MKDIIKKLKKEKEILKFINLHLKGMRIINPITFLYTIFIPNSNELFFFGFLLYTSYFKILQIIYKIKIKKSNKELITILQKTKLDYLRTLKKDKNKSLKQSKSKETFKYHFKENTPPIKKYTINKTKKLTKKR